MTSVFIGEKTSSIKSKQKFKLEFKDLLNNHHDNKSLLKTPARRHFDDLITLGFKNTEYQVTVNSSPRCRKLIYFLRYRPTHGLTNCTIAEDRPTGTLSNDVNRKLTNARKLNICKGTMSRLHSPMTDEDLVCSYVPVLIDSSIQLQIAKVRL